MSVRPGIIFRGRTFGGRRGVLGVFHGRCAAALGHSGGAQWQNCPWCPLAKLATAIDVKVSDSAVLGEDIDNSDKPEGLSAVIDEKHESDEYVCGKWASEKGESSIFWDYNMNCLSFEEPVDDSGYLHGWLDRNWDGWQARLAFYDMDEEPWYSPSCEEEPEYVGDVHVRLLSEMAIEHISSFLMTMSGSRQLY